MNLSARVRQLRYAKGWGLDELASRAEISRTALYQIESGRTEVPRAATLRGVARALGVTPESLLSREAGGETPASRTTGAELEAARPAARSRMGYTEQIEVELKFRMLLDSSLREAAVKIVEELFRLLPRSIDDEGTGASDDN